MMMVNVLFLKVLGFHMIPLVLASSRCVPDTLSCRKSAEWECSLHCKPLTDVEIVAIVTLRAAFEGSIEEARQALAECDFGLALSPGSPLMCTNDLCT